jgi:hypothetical protein
MIQDLPDINDIENTRASQRTQENRDQYLDYSHRGSDVNTSKFIRQKQSLMNESGMRLVEPYQNIEGYASYNNAYSTGPASNYSHQYPQGPSAQPNEYYQDGTAINPYPFRNAEIMEGYEAPSSQPQVLGNCRDIAEHVKNCQVCGKLYNTDKTIYIIAIVLLLVICAILLRKILNV